MDDLVNDLELPPDEMETSIMAQIIRNPAIVGNDKTLYGKYK